MSNTDDEPASIHKMYKDGTPECWDWDLDEVAQCISHLLSYQLIYIQILKYVKKRAAYFKGRSGVTTKMREDVESVVLLIEFCLFVFDPCISRSLTNVLSLKI